MTESKTSRLLRLLREGKTLDQAARILGLDPRTANLLATTLASHGKLRLVTPPATRGCDCTRCPLRSVCLIPRLTPRQR